MFKSFLLKKKINLIKSKIQKLNLEFNESVDLEATNNFWKDKKLINWLRNFGIEITNLPPFVKGGSGVAYFLPNNMVLKITNDIIEANIAKMLIDSNVDHNMISVLKIENYYFLLQQKLETKSNNDLKTAADLVTVMIDDNNLEEFPNDENKIKSMCLKTIQSNDFPIEFLEKMLLIIEMLKNLEQSTGFFHNDAGPSNIGFKNGKPYVFDLGPNKTKNYDSNKEIEKINNKRKSLGLSAHDFK